MPTLANTKKAIWPNLLSIQNEAISVVAMRCNELWLVQENHAAVKLDSNGFWWNKNLLRKQNWIAKSTNFKENAGKLKSVFVIRAAPWAEKLGCCLEYCRRWKNMLGKLAVAVNTEKHSIRVLNERWWFSNQFDIVSDTPYIFDTVGRKLYYGLLCSLLCPGTDLRTFACESKVTCLFHLSLRSDDLILYSWHQSVSTIIFRLKKVEFFK